MEWSKIWNIEPVPFHADLIELCEQAVLETAGTLKRLPSGPLHDAAEVARAGIPTVMMFVQSLRGIKPQQDRMQRRAPGTGGHRARSVGLKDGEVDH